MDVEKFEQDILELAFETDVRITTASVAYYLGVPSTKAEPMLEELLERGVLEFDSDAEGNLYYRVVDAAASESEKISQLKQERNAGIDGGVGAGSSPTDSGGPDQGGPHLIGDATVDETGGDGGAYSPRTGPGSDSAGVAEESPAASRTTDGTTTGTVGERGVSPVDAAPRSSSADRGRAGAVEADGAPESSSGGGAGDPLAGVTRKRAAMDAELDSCGDDPLVVQSEAQCEPRPFEDSSPVVASCSDQNEGAATGLMAPDRSRTSIEDVGHSRRASAGTASSGAITYRERDQFEKPEHQPGMSLLLSLILCGTGQIYNGEVSKGIMMMVLCFLLWFVLLGWVVHIWSIVDSVVVAERINRQSGDNSQTTGPSRQLSGG